MKNIIEYLENFSSRDNSPYVIDKVKNEIITLKRNFQESLDEVNANRFCIYQQILTIQELYLKSFQDLKYENFYDAWCNLEKCEIKILFILKHLSDEEKDKFWITFINDKVNKFQSVYPYKLFFSPEIIEKEKKCSICDQVVSLRNHCGHDVGNIYNGEECYRIVTKGDFLNVAIVEKPLQKYSVVFLKDSENGKDVDHYNYSIVKYLINGLVDPFDNWNVTKSNKLHPHSKFGDIGRNDKCPCGSDKKYKKCCLPKNGVQMLHYEFEFPEKTDKTHLGFRYY